MNAPTAQLTAAQLAAYLDQWMDVDEQRASELLRYLRPCLYARGAHLFGFDETVDELVLLLPAQVSVCCIHRLNPRPEAALRAVTGKLTAAALEDAVIDAAELGQRADHFRWAKQPEAITHRVADWCSRASQGTAT